MTPTSESESIVVNDDDNHSDEELSIQENIHSARS